MTIAAKPRVGFWCVLFGTFFLALAAFTLKEIFFAGPSINPERNITVWGERLAIAARNRAQFEPEPRLEYSVRSEPRFRAGGLSFSKNRNRKSCSIRFQDPKKLEGTVLLEAGNELEYSFPIPVANP